ncbi:flagellar transcriptional regulator FlhD [Niveibacterium sp. SC-1]|uniref:flagellar transcriptional regulator FlhD n=1 Tax=Niveibacterium sp. SC-1 TaxID=3135646 RepID=UPI00311D7951
MRATAQLSEEVRDLNLSYLMLAQRLLSEDRQAAMFRLGVGEDAADVLASLSPAQVLRMASSGMLLCQMRFSDDMLLGLLSSHEREPGIASIHAAIVAAGRPVENLA